MNAADTLILARAQFGLNIAFHILFPSLTIALAWYLVYFRAMYARTRAVLWLDIYKFWAKIFALSFAMGVVTGIVMSFQFGTNWPGFMSKVGNVAGPLLAYEVLTAFFLEASFLGVMLFGMNRVPGWMHMGATILVAIGTSVSAFWILALNSWMHTPSGHQVVDGVLIARDWWEVIFNPSFPYRFTHMMLASGLTASFVVIGLSAWCMLKAARDEGARQALRAGLLVAAVIAPLQIFVGDQHGLNTLQHQPAKIAAMEALWQSRTAAPLVLLGWPDEAQHTNHFALEVPGFASLILKHDVNAEVKGIDAFEPDRPAVMPLFLCFRIMVGMGVAMLGLAWFGVFMTRAKRTLPRWALWVCAASTFSGWIATLAGWMVTEIGRQPWLVYGVLRTADAVGPVSQAKLGASLTAYAATYGALFLAYLVVLTHLSAKGTGAKS